MQKLLSETDLDVCIEQQQQLIKFVFLLVKWNKIYNLTSVRDPNEMLIKHIMDSIVVSPYLKGKRLIDVGTGAGLPGLPLAILNPDKQFLLLDSLGKRLKFIRQAVLELGLKNVKFVQSRVEKYQPDKKFDVILSRAFASLKDMLFCTEHLVNKKGFFLALKGQFPDKELKKLDVNFIFMDNFQLTVPGLKADRCLVKIKKIYLETK